MTAANIKAIMKLDIHFNNADEIEALIDLMLKSLVDSAPFSALTEAEKDVIMEMGAWKYNRTRMLTQ